MYTHLESCLTSCLTAYGPDPGLKGYFPLCSTSEIVYQLLPDCSKGRIAFAYATVSIKSAVYSHSCGPVMSFWALECFLICPGETPIFLQKVYSS